jgi:hypothetical protein
MDQVDHSEQKSRLIERSRHICQDIIELLFTCPDESGDNPDDPVALAKFKMMEKFTIN